MTRLNNSLVENVALLINKSSEKKPNLYRCQKYHPIILDKLISTCPLWLDSLYDQAYVGTFDELIRQIVDLTVD
jgi:hypothetical protein